MLRTDVAGCATFAELLGRVRDTALGAFANQDLPFERLVGDLRIAPDPARNPLFQVLFELEDSTGAAYALPGLEAEILPVGWRPAKLDLTLHLARHDDGSYAGDIEYATALFDRSTVEGLAGEFLELLERVAAEPGTPPHLLGGAGGPAAGDASGGPAIDYLVASEDYAEPSTAAERIIAEIWSDVLDLDQIGVHDDFFQLGGHSVLAAQVHLRIQDELDIDLPLRALFDATTLGELAAEVERAVQEDVARLSDAEVDAMLSEEGT